MSERRALKLHPRSRCAAAKAIEVEIVRPTANLLVLRYSVVAATPDLRLPGIAPRLRADELWRHTCFEAFLGAPPDPAYHEFNFSPSTQWAAYRFTGYRGGMEPASEVGEPRIATRWEDGAYVLEASLMIDGLAGFRQGVRRLGLCAVIEETGGDTSYWALAHPPGRADFHHRDCLALELPPPERS